MTTRGMITRSSRRRLGGALAAAAAAMVVTAAPASADGYIPFNCPVTTTGFYTSSAWDDNCYLGRSSVYQNNATNVIVLQRILRASNFYPGPQNDGLFGAQTETAVQGYRNSAGPLTSGSIVDSAMWSHMADYKLAYGGNSYGGVSCPGRLFYKPYNSNNISIAKGTYDPYLWFTRDNTNSSWQAMSTLDAASAPRYYDPCAY